MKNKKLLKIIALTLIILTSASIWAGTSIFGVTLYNMDAENILDNISREGDQVVVPIVYSKPDSPITVDRVKADFKKKGLTVKNISTEKIGTGTQITTNENKIVYNFLIYGDVNGDGEVDLVDAQKIILHVRNPQTKALTGLPLLAANVSREDDEVDLVDAQRIILFIRTSKTLMSDLPKINQADIQKPTIYVTGSTIEVMEIGTEYIEKGATAEDDFDGNVTSKIVTTGEVDTNTAGTYTIKYDVEDSAGNKADTKTRRVTVEDVIVKVQPEALPNQLTYNYAENFNLTGTKLRVFWKSGKQEVISDTSKFTVLNYNSKEPGEQKIGIQYKTFKIENYANVTVKNKIDVLAINTTFKDNTDLSADVDQILSGDETVMQVQTSRQFALGKVEGVGENLSTLDLSKLTVAVTSANKNDMESLSITNEGIITGKVKAKKAGDYEITVKYINENNETVTFVKTVNAIINNTISNFELQTIEAHKVRRNDEAPPLYRAITYYNANGEVIENTDERANPIVNDDVTIECDDPNVDILKCNNAKADVTEAEILDKKVTFIGIRTRYETEEEITFKIKILEANPLEVKFITGAPTQIKGIEGMTRDVNEPISITEGQITKIPLRVVDQYGDNVEIIYSDIKVDMSIANDEAEADSIDEFNAETAKLGIAAKWPINEIKLYEGENGETESVGSTNPITYIGFAFENGYEAYQEFTDLYGANKATMKNALQGKVNMKLYLKVGGGIYTYPIQTTNIQLSE